MMINAIFSLKSIIILAIILLLAGAIGLWINTPDLFLFFNQAFCAH